MYLVYNFRAFCVILKILFLLPWLDAFYIFHLLFIRGQILILAESFPLSVIVCFILKNKKTPSSFNLKMLDLSIESLHMTFFRFLVKMYFPQYISPYPFWFLFFFSYMLGSCTMQYVILTYMKHLGVKVKEPRNLEQKRGRIGFLPKIKVVVLWPGCICLSLPSMGASLELKNPLLYDTVEVGMILPSSLLH